ncbi:carbohydrate sulfotransferase 11-like [Amblyomma americanum]
MSDGQPHASKEAARLPQCQAVRAIAGISRALPFRVATPGPGTLGCLLLAGVLMTLLLALRTPGFQTTTLKIASSWGFPDPAPKIHTEDYEAADDVLSRRVRIRQVCLRYARSKELQKPTPGWGSHQAPGKITLHCNPEQCPLFIDEKRSLAFCIIAKVASTSLKAFFKDLLGIRVRFNESDRRSWDDLHRAFHMQTHRLGPRTLFGHDKGRGYTKALFVRHPFERLVSAYVDKALRPRSEIAWFYKAFWEKIPGVKAQNRSPTFPEFVDLLLGTPVRNWDEHWSPYYARCQPCLLDYDFVGKVETAARDFPLFFSKIGVDGGRFRRLHVSREAGARASLVSTNGTILTPVDYFRQLSFDQIMGLYSRYFYDFELFGYEFRDYLV